jgi:hypothetical protein
MYIYIYIYYNYIHAHIYIYMWICIYVHIYIFTHSCIGDISCKLSSQHMQNLPTLEAVLFLLRQQLDSQKPDRWGRWLLGWLKKDTVRQPDGYCTAGSIVHLLVTTYVESSPVVIEFDNAVPIMQVRCDTKSGSQWCTLHLGPWMWTMNPPGFDLDDVPCVCSLLRSR